MPEITIPQDVQNLVQSATNSAALVSQFQITTPVQYEAADTALRELKEQERAVKDKLDFLKAPAKEQIKRLDEFFKPVLTRISEAKQDCDRSMTGYRNLQRQLAEEEQRRQREIAEKERARLEAQAAAERAEAERKAREKEEKARALEAAGKAGQAAKARTQAQAIVEAAESKASVHEQMAAAVPAPSVEANIPKIAGSFGRKTWKARPRQSTVDHPNGQRKLTSLEVLILAVADGIAMNSPWPPVNLLKADDSNLNKQAVALKESFNVPGYESYAEESTVSRRR